ncbi:cAMP-dependent protein kinase catalytic subunit-like [Agrilus planipennis]|uniref:cAMP-dependent protein kinase n=1 Tax=Agrilus planipennis TaxID=224129 RepID=A0A1W4X851_AGRPL|nr:cAMP-dependent protein kinase catalytic subunit-like [Agrilus planipennis]
MINDYLVKSCQTVKCISEQEHGNSEMVDNKLAKHFIDYDAYLKRAKKEFETTIKTELTVTASLDDFKLVKTLGTGSFGRVVLAKHKTKDMLFAIKLMDKDHVVRTKQVQHTIYEIRLMAAYKFPFLITLEYFFKDNVYLGIVMPFINGGEMFTHLRTLKKFDEQLAKFYAAQVILAFEYIHYLGVVYRDLKPENIMMDKEGYIKITDYGFCKKIDEQRTYTLCGTPEYLAPEIIMSQGYNKSVDWWSLGILIFEMNAGYPPFYGRDPMKIYEKIVSGKYHCPSTFSRPLKELIGNILQVDRSKRWGILKNGAKDVKSHEWFRGLDWDAVFQRKVKPSYKPRLKGDDDTSNFDVYDEEPLRKASTEMFPDEFAKITL